MVKRLILILGDQLSSNIAALREGDRDEDVVVMAEVMDEASYVPHHPKKIAFIFAAMRKFASALEADGWRVAYRKLDNHRNEGSLDGELLRRAEEFDAGEVLVTRPGEWRVIQLLDEVPLKVTQLHDNRFISMQDEFDDWAEGRRELRMEYFYRMMRRKTGILMDGDKPVGGKWNFDKENRKAPPDKDLFDKAPREFRPDEGTREVLDLVAARFGDNFGTLEPFRFATDAGEAKAALDRFIDHRLASFGDYQDAMLLDDGYLSHAVIGLYINAGLLDPLEVCKRAEAAYRDGHAPINAVEGFIRQILGWREFMRGIYFREGPEYTSRNVLRHRRKLPSFYWDAETDMACVSAVVAQTRDEAYAHHIQRLMVTGNFALLAGIDPAHVHEWYLAVYADAYEWVEAPNVIGMSQFADGGIVGSKPYVSSGAYINRMSDYCGTCAYSVTRKTGEGACPFNLLYWHFLDRHRDRLENSGRMSRIYANWDRMDADRRRTVLKEAGALLERLDAGGRI